MREQMDVNTLSWNDPGQEPAAKRFSELAAFAAPGTAAIGLFNTASFADTLPGETLPELGERLRTEMNRGREYLLQVQIELGENRRLLEQWAQYEQTCSVQPLDHLVQSVYLKQAVEKFLVGWLKRRKKDLDRLERELASAGKNLKRPAAVK